MDDVGALPFSPAPDPATAVAAAPLPAPTMRSSSLSYVRNVAPLTARLPTSIGQHPFTETIYGSKYSVYEGFLGENTRLRELRRRRDFGRFWAVVGNLGLFMAVFA